MTGDALRVLVLDQAVGLWGAQRYVLRLAPLLRERDVDLTLAAPRSLAAYDAWEASGFEPINLDLPIERNIRSAGRPDATAVAREARTSLRTVKLIVELVRRRDYDAIWSNAHWLHLEASLAGRICRKPVVLHLHEEVMPGLATRLRGLAVRFATRTVAVSHAVGAGLPTSLAERVCVIPNGVDVAALHPPRDDDWDAVRRLRARFGIGDEDVMILAATRIDPDKRIEDLTAVMQKIDDPRAKLVVAGITSRFPDYERDVRAQGERALGGRVTFCGNRDDMAAMFQASDVVLHAGTVEGMPLGLLEAQACGKPVVAYDVAGVREAVVDGTTGWLAAVRDVASLHRALAKLVHDGESRTKMGAAARAHVLAHHQLETQAACNAELLKRLCEDRRT